MTDGVLVAISYGGSPKMSEVSYTSAFKGNVHVNWNTGSQDAAYTTTSAYGVKAGYNHYTGRGFATSLDVSSFEVGLPYYWQLESSTGAVLVQGQVPAAPASWNHLIQPTRVGALFDVFVPSGTSKTTVRISPSFSTSSGSYLYTTGTGMQQFDFTPYAPLTPDRTYEYRIENGSGTVVASGTFTTLW